MTNEFTPRVVYAGDDSTFEFAITFDVDRNADVYVELVRVDNTVKPLVPNQDYVIDGSNVVMRVDDYRDPPAAGELIVIMRRMPLFQPSGRSAMTSAVFRHRLESLTRIFQQLREQLDRTLHIGQAYPALYRMSEVYEATPTMLLVYPLTYDEDDANGQNSLTLTGAGPAITPAGFEGDGESLRYTNSAIPVAFVGAGSLRLQATISAWQLTREGTRDVLVSLCENDVTARPALEFASVIDDSDASQLNLAVRGYTSSVQTQHVSRKEWTFLRRFPAPQSGGNNPIPQALLFLDTNTLLVSAHYADAESIVYKLDATTGVVLGSFSFGTSTHRHVAAAARDSNGAVWFTDFDTGHVLKVDLQNSFSSGAAVILVDWDTSILDTVSGIAFVETGGTEYVLLAEYNTTGTPYVYVVHVADMSGTFAVADRFKRFQYGLFGQGLVVDGAGIAHITRNQEQGGSIATRFGYVETYAISTAIASLADGAALTSTGKKLGPSRFVEDIDIHPTTGEYWTMTEGRLAVDDDTAFLSIWHSPLNGTPAENTIAALFDGVSTVNITVNGFHFADLAWAITATPEVLSIGGPPAASAGWTNGFAGGTVKNIGISATEISAGQYTSLVAGTYETETLSEFTLAITNPGAESGTTTGWTNEVGALGVRSINPAPYAGSFYFFGGTSAATLARQRFDIASTTGLSTTQLDALIAAGGLWARARWQQANFNGTADPGACGIRFTDTGGTEITLSYGSIIDLDAALTWFKRGHVLDVPAAARNIDFVQRMDRTAGTNNDTYVDQTELVLYARI